MVTQPSYTVPPGNTRARNSMVRQSRTWPNHATQAPPLVIRYNAGGGMSQGPGAPPDPAALSRRLNRYLVEQRLRDTRRRSREASQMGSSMRQNQNLAMAAELTNLPDLEEPVTATENDREDQKVDGGRPKEATSENSTTDSEISPLAALQYLSQLITVGADQANLCTDSMREGNRGHRPRSTHSRQRSVKVHRPSGSRTRRPGSVMSQRPGSIRSQRPGSIRSQRPGSIRSQRPGSLRSQRPGSLRSQCPGSLRNQRPESVRSQRPGSITTQRPGSMRTQRPGSIRTQQPVSIRVTTRLDRPRIRSTEQQQRLSTATPSQHQQRRSTRTWQQSPNDFHWASIVSTLDRDYHAQKKQRQTIIDSTGTWAQIDESPVEASRFKIWIGPLFRRTDRAKASMIKAVDRNSDQLPENQCSEEAVTETRVLKHKPSSFLGLFKRYSSSAK